eukprot:s2727_g10.t1
MVSPAPNTRHLLRLGGVKASPQRPANRITRLFKGLWQWLLILFRFLWLLPRLVLAYLLDAWYDPWSLVRPRATGNEAPGRRIRGLGITPQMVRYAPGQNPRGEERSSGRWRHGMGWDLRPHGPIVAGAAGHATWNDSSAARRTRLVLSAHPTVAAWRAWPSGEVMPRNARDGFDFSYMSNKDDSLGFIAEEEHWKDRVNCPFYLKIGACRNGERCNRAHVKPTSGHTILIPHMYPCIPEAMQVANDDEWDDETYARQQEKLVAMIMALGEPDEGFVSDRSLIGALIFAKEHLEHFYEEVFLELAKFGEAGRSLVTWCRELMDSDVRRR